MGKIRRADNHYGISSQINYTNTDTFSMFEGTFVFPIESTYNDRYFDMETINHHIGSQNRKFLIKNGKMKEGFKRCQYVRPIAARCNFRSIIFG